MQKRKSSDLFRTMVNTMKELPHMERILFLFQSAFSLAAFVICFLGLATVIPKKTANPLALILLSIVFLLSGIQSFQTRRIVSCLYLFFFFVILLLSIGTFF